MSTTLAARGQEPKRQRGHLRVAAIMQAGAELFAEKGYDGTTMTEIAARSGTATASLYRFFPAKEHLAEALLQQYAKQALDGLGELASRAGAMAPQALADAFVDYGFALQSKRSFAIGLVDWGGVSDERRRQFRMAMLEAIGAILTGAIPALPSAKAQLMAAVLLNLFKGLAAIGSEKPAARQALLAETKTMVGLYLAAAARSGG